MNNIQQQVYKHAKAETRFGLFASVSLKWFIKSRSPDKMLDILEKLFDNYSTLITSYFIAYVKYPKARLLKLFLGSLFLQTERLRFKSK